MKKRLFPVVAWGLLGVLALSTAWLFGSVLLTEDRVLSATHDDPRVAAFADWPARYQEIDGDKNYSIAMGFMRGLSQRFTEASGRTVVNFETGQVSGTLRGLPPLEEGQQYELLMVHNVEGPENSASLDTGLNGDDIISLGVLDPQEPVITVDHRLDVERLAPFEPDLVMVRLLRPDGSEEFIIGGLADLFYKWNRRMSLLRGAAGVEEGAVSGLTQVEASDLANLIRRGERLFFNQTFAGNGRTCGTCHRAENNFTIDPKFIAALPDRDPLFVAEFVPELIFGNPANLGPNGEPRRFENPRLMREVGLIVENTNGFADLDAFTMRGVPHTLALRVSIDSSQQLPGETACGADPEEPPCPRPRLGWSGDGAPAGDPASGRDGSLRAFAIGAVTQHFTRTVDRVPGRDFREPRAGELDAMAAFQISLGRQEEFPDLRSVKLTDPGADKGRELFRDVGCNACHFNAGANAAPLLSPTPSNFNFNTGIETMNDAPADLIDPRNNRPDDGFGNPGNDTFNTPVVVEAADTPPFFHDNSVATVEGAVAFYVSPNFAGNIDLSGAGIEHVAAFMRVINSEENLSFAQQYIKSALHELDVMAAAATDVDKEPNRRRAIRQTRLSQEESQDAIIVLAQRDLHPETQEIIEKGRQHLREAVQLIRNNRLEEAAKNLKRAFEIFEKAKKQMVQR